MRAIRVLAAFGVLMLAAFGCDLFNDLTTFTFSTDPQRFSIDSNQLGLSIPGSATIPPIPCAGNDVCALASSKLACQGGSYSCKIVCGATKSCAVTATAESAMLVDVSSKIKNSTQASALSKVSLQRLVLKVNDNSLTWRTPAMEVFVGPSSATRTTAPGVVRLGTIAAIDAKTVPEPMNIETTEEGKAALGEFIKNYTVPFNMLARASLSFASGDPVPQGRLSLEVIAYLEVEPMK